MKDYSFGNFICELRQRNGLSQFQLGTLVGVSNKAISKWENGAAMPKMATCHKLALVLGVSVDELLACKYHTPADAEKGIFAMKKELWKMVQSRLHDVYGDYPHVSILGRYETERQMLLSNDLIVHFGFLSKLATTAHSEGSDLFLFGNINSSFIAWLMGITPVNPLEPHYYCPSCKKVEFVTDAADGWDLPEKDCTCGNRMYRDGHSIPCESALTRLGRKAHFDVNLSPALQRNASNRQKMWQCNNRFKRDIGCRMPALSDNKVKAMFAIACARYVSDHPQISADRKALLKQLGNSKEIKKQIKELELRIQEYDILLTTNTIDGLPGRMQQLRSQHGQANQQLEALQAEHRSLRGRKRKIRTLIGTMIEQSYHEDRMVRVILDRAIIQADKSISFVFKDGYTCVVAHESL